ncbi:hypothetical protein [Pseudothermotoga sp.]|uniref:hypothetical protein n=1 Tax=Pseudothermotoga sp. TaxID=2033661 RepID=UPI0031F61718
MPRKLAIILSLSIVLVLALYLDVYDYLRFNNLSAKLESSLARIEQYDKNVSEKRDYLTKLEKLLQPRTNIKQVESLAQSNNLSFSTQKDGTFLIEGRCEPERLTSILTEFLSYANLIIQSVHIDGSEISPVTIEHTKAPVFLNIRVVLKGVKLE